MKRQRIAAILALAVGALGASAWGQVRQINTQLFPGQALDKSPLVGSSGYNAGVTLGGYGSYARDSQLFVTGQVTGLGAFHGTIPYTPPEQFQGSLPSASLSRFQSQSVGAADVLAGRTLGATAYFDPTKTILKAPAIVAGLAQPGTNVPGNPTDAAVGASINARLFVDAITEYQSLLPTSPGRALTVPPVSTAVGAYVPAGTGGAAIGGAGGAGTPRPSVQAQEEMVFGRGMLFDLLNERDRTRLGQEFYNLDRATRPIDTGIRAGVEGRISAESNYAAPGDPNQWRSTENIIRRPGEANAPRGPVLLHRQNVDVFVDILQTLRLRKEAGIEAPGSLPDANAAGVGMVPTASGRIVELLQGGRIVLHSLAGRGRDAVNRYLEEGEKKLRAGKFYEAVEAFGMAAVLGPGNPLPRMGRGLALLGAGEPLSAARELTAAMEAFPVLMELRMDLPGIMGATSLRSRLAELDARLAQPEEELDPLMPFLACFLHEAQGESAQARVFARQVQDGAAESKVVRAYAEFVLTGKHPTSQPATAPATQPAKETAAAMAP